MSARLLACLLAAALPQSAGMAVAQETADETAEAEMDVSSPLLAYRCAGGVELQLAELTLETGEVLVLLFLDGEEIQMQVEPAASGVKYRALDPDLALVWHGKGETGFLYREMPGGEAEPVEADCRLH